MKAIIPNEGGDNPPTSSSPNPIIENGMSIRDSNGVVITVSQYEDMKRSALKYTGGSSENNLGARIESAIAQRFNDEIIGKMVGNVFGSTNPAPKKDGIAGIIGDILNSQFAYGAGQSLGAKAPEIIAALGKDKINGLIEAYKRSNDPNYVPEPGPAQLTTEDQRKKVDATIISLNPNDQNDVNSFAQATNMTDYNAAKNILISEQNRILKERGIENSSQPKDINRQLMQQYENSTPNTQQNVGIDPFFGGRPISQLLEMILLCL
jgi:hypothetical protein